MTFLFSIRFNLWIIFFSFQDTDAPDLTNEQRIELCLTVPCKVELFHSNVCNGVEKSWPKRMFKKANFQLLNPKEQRCIYRDMERKAVSLHNLYVDETRLAARRQRRTSRALAPFYELIYRKNLFLRIKALDEPEAGYDAIINESNILTDSEADESQQTVIDTGNTAGTQKSNEDRESIDLSGNDCSSDVASENAEHQNGRRTLDSHWKSKSTYTITQNFSIQEIADTMDNNNGTIIARECNVSSSHDEYNVEMSESVVSSSQDSNFETQSQSQNHHGNSTPELQSIDLMFGTPSINIARHRTNVLLNGDEGSEIEFDSLDFLSQGMTAPTSTQ